MNIQVLVSSLIGNFSSGALIGLAGFVIILLIILIITILGKNNGESAIVP